MDNKPEKDKMGIGGLGFESNCGKVVSNMLSNSLTEEGGKRVFGLQTNCPFFID